MGSPTTTSSLVGPEETTVIISYRNKQAEKAGCEVAVTIVKLQFEGPVILKDVQTQISY